MNAEVQPTTTIAATATAIPATPTSPNDPAVPAVPVWNGEREFFAPADLGKMKERAKFLVTTPHNGRLIYMAGWSTEWPEGAGGAILPLAKNFKKPGEDTATRTIYGILVYPIWPADAYLAQNDAGEPLVTGGEDYVKQLVLSAQAVAILNPLRRQNVETNVGLTFDGLPSSMAQHIEGMDTERGTVKAYMEAAKEYLPTLKKRHMMFNQFTAPILRQMCSNANAAKEFSAGFEQRGGWLHIIDILEKITIRQGGNPEIYQTWRDTREDAKSDDQDLADMDLESLNAPVPVAAPTPAA